MDDLGDSSHTFEAAVRELSTARSLACLRGWAGLRRCVHEHAGHRGASDARGERFEAGAVGCVGSESFRANGTRPCEGAHHAERSLACCGGVAFAISWCLSAQLTGWCFWQHWVAAEAISTTFPELFAGQTERYLKVETIKNQYLNDVLEKMFDDGIGACAPDAQCNQHRRTKLALRHIPDDAGPAAVKSQYFDRLGNIRAPATPYRRAPQLLSTSLNCGRPTGRRSRICQLRP